MNTALAVLAIAVVAGGILAVSARDSLLTLAGVAVTVVLAPILTGPGAEPLGLALRLVAAALATYLLWIALRIRVPTRGTVLGWPVEALTAGAAGIAGVAAALSFAERLPASAGLGGAPEALGAGFGLAAVAAAPLVRGGDLLRLTAGILLAIHAATLIRAGLAGAAPPAEQLAVGSLIVATAAASAFLLFAAIRSTGEVALGPGRLAGAHRAAVPAGGAPASGSASARAPGLLTGWLERARAPRRHGPAGSPPPDRRPVGPRSAGSRRRPPN